MSDRAHFKAHEWIIFLLAYSLPVFQKFMKKEYFEHWALLVDGISILVKESIAKSRIIYATQCFISFINGVETLYGKKHVSYNVHQLAHLPESVENWGPLFTHSAFIYEDFYQNIQNYVKSANGVSIQICDAFRLKCVIDRLLIICDKDLNFYQREYLNNVLKIKPKLISTRTIGSIGVLGKPTIMTYLPNYLYLSVSRICTLDNDNTYFLYTRCIINQKTFTSKSYNREKKRANFNVLLNDNRVKFINLM